MGSEFGVCLLQVNLTWLDLSFNNISKLEGLSKLTKLTDLSSFSNKLDRIENIQTLEDLVVLSLGKPVDQKPQLHLMPDIRLQDTTAALIGFGLNL